MQSFDLISVPLMPVYDFLLVCKHTSANIDYTTISLHLGKVAIKLSLVEKTFKVTDDIRYMFHSCCYDNLLIVSMVDKMHTEKDNVIHRYVDVTTIEFVWRSVIWVCLQNFGLYSWPQFLGKYITFAFFHQFLFAYLSLDFRMFKLELYAVCLNLKAATL